MAEIRKSLGSLDVYVVRGTMPNQPEKSELDGKQKVSVASAAEILAGQIAQSVLFALAPHVNMISGATTIERPPGSVLYVVKQTILTGSVAGTVKLTMDLHARKEN